jgi:hypothetical protein
MHFFYNYKLDLEKKLSEVFQRELKKLEERRNRQRQLDVAQNLIENYYNKLASDLKDIVEVSNGKISFMSHEDMIIKFIMYEHYVRYTRMDQGIEVEIGTYDESSGLIEGRINSNIIPGEKRCVVKKIGKVHDGSHFDENTINYYMNKAFSGLDVLKD